MFIALPLAAITRITLTIPLLLPVGACSIGAGAIIGTLAAMVGGGLGTITIGRGGGRLSLRRGALIMHIIKATHAEAQLLRVLRNADGDLQLIVQSPRKGAWIVTTIREGARSTAVGASFSSAWTACKRETGQGHNIDKCRG